MILGEESVPIDQDNDDSNSRLLGFPNDDDTISVEVIIYMDTKDVILELRTKSGLSQLASGAGKSLFRGSIAKVELLEASINIRA